MSAQWPAGGRGRHPVAPLRTQPAQVYTPPTQPPVFDPALTVSATVLMVAGGIVGFIGVCSRYYQISIPDGRGPMTDNLGLAMSGPGWAVPYAGPAAVILLCAAGLALFDMRWVPRPRGAQPSPWPKYVLMAGFGGAAALAFASGRVGPNNVFRATLSSEVVDFTLLRGFWLAMLGALAGLVGAALAYVGWVREQDARPQAQMPTPAPMPPPAIPAPSATPAPSAIVPVQAFAPSVEVSDYMRPPTRPSRAQ